MADSVVQLIATVRPSVVRIHAYGRPVDPMRPFMDSNGVGKGVGTGFIIEPPVDTTLTKVYAHYYFILTCAHVVAGCRHDKVFVVLPNWSKAERQATIVSTCPDLDVALLAMAKTPLLREVTGGPGVLDKVVACNIDMHSGSPDVGTAVFAVGYPNAADLTTTTGNYSAYQDGRIKHSAPIAPGSSGGPLFIASRGGRARCIGINSSGIPGAVTGFAVPMTRVLHALGFMLKGVACRDAMGPGRVVRTPGIGIRMHNGIGVSSRLEGGGRLDRPPAHEAAGVVAHHIVRGSVFYDAMCPGDIIVAVGIRSLDGKEVWNDVDHLGEVFENNGERAQRLPLNEFINEHDPFTVQVNLQIRRNAPLVCRNGNGAKPVCHNGNDVGTFKTGFRALKDYRDGALRVTVDHYDTVDSIVMMGMCLVPLTMNHARTGHGAIALRCMTPNEADMDHVLVSHVFPATTVYQQGAFGPGTVVALCNGCPVHTLADIRALVADSLRTNNIISLESIDGVRIVMDTGRFVFEEAHMARDGTYGQASLDNFPLMNDQQVAGMIAGLRGDLQAQFAIDVAAWKINDAEWLYRYNREALSGYDTISSLVRDHAERPRGGAAGAEDAEDAAGDGSLVEATLARSQHRTGKASGRCGIERRRAARLRERGLRHGEDSCDGRKRTSIGRRHLPYIGHRRLADGWLAPAAYHRPPRCPDSRAARGPHRGLLEGVHVGARHSLPPGDLHRVEHLRHLLVSLVGQGESYRVGTM